jgi:hypothetical protein
MTWLDNAFTIWLNWTTLALTPVAVAICIKGWRETR